MIAVVNVKNFEVVYAGAFMLPQDTGQFIISVTGTDAGRGFNKQGSSARVLHTRKYEPSVFIEYGANDWLNLFAQTSYVNNFITAPVNATYSGFGYLEIGGRVRILQQGSFVLSAQSSLRVPAPANNHNVAQLGNTGLETDNRALAGMAFNIGGWASFLDAGIGYRTRAGNPANEWRGDFTLGTRPIPSVLLLMQSFNIISDGAGKSGFGRTSSHKLQFSLVYDFTSKWSAQFGGYATIAGQNSNRDNGVIATIWRKF